MKELYVGRETVYRVMYDSMARAVFTMPVDVQARFAELISAEKNEAARHSLELTLTNCVGMNQQGNLLLCPDTGAPTFYVRIGDNVSIEDGFSTLQEECRRAMTDMTMDGKLRPNLVHPITRQNTGTNTGYFMPHIDLTFDHSISHMDMVAVPISGGSETSGTFYRMMSPVDGKKGILRFILDCVKTSTFAGRTCPPNVVGIGIGGTADVCMRLAKQAAVLRPIGRRHPDSDIAEFEKEVLELIGSLGIGPMGRGGDTGALDVHVEYAATHVAGLPVAYNAQCQLGRRGAMRISEEGEVSFVELPDWDLAR